MEIRVERDIFTPASTAGKLYVDGVYQCVTLEPTRRPDGVKIPGKTAIPPGRYKVEMLPSARFRTCTPHVLAVPGFDAIEIHVGNYPRDTEGCTLVGKIRAVDCIYESIPAVALLYNKIETFLRAAGGEVWITYEDLPGDNQQMSLRLEATA
jgi:Family of unknown function (DUF5675)